LFTNGTATLSAQHIAKLEEHRIKVVEKEIERLEQTNGYLQNIVFKDGTKSFVNVMYAPNPFEQHCQVPQTLGCELTDEGYLKIDASHKTSINGVFACGDNVTRIRTVANAVAMGTTAGIMVNKEIIVERF
jgi:thioredoxin reductase